MSHDPDRSRFRRSACLAGLLVAGIGVPASAEPGTAIRTAYLRDGPSIRFRPIDEVVAGTSVDIVECRAGWCRLWVGDAAGFLPEGVIRRGPGPAGLAPPETCFVDGQAGYHGTRAVRFCHPGAAP